MMAAANGNGAMGVWFVITLAALSLLLCECLFYGSETMPVAAHSLGTTAATLAIACLLAPMLWSERQPTLGNTSHCSLLTAATAALLLMAGTPAHSWTALALPLVVGVLATSLLMGAAMLFLNRRCNTPALRAQRLVLCALLLAATAPLWLAPLAEQLAMESFTNFILALSPVSYLAALIDYDALRSGWLYNNTPWGGLRYDYPNPLIQTLIYAGVAALLCLGASRKHQPPVKTDDTPVSFHPTCKETTQ